MRERTRLESIVAGHRTLEQELSDNLDLAELAAAEGDEGVLAEAAAALADLSRRVLAVQRETLLSGEADANASYLEVHAGAGGTESQDWAEMLLRMYLRWGDRRGYKTEIMEYQPGEEAGLKRVTFTVAGDYAYGYLKCEAGIHRLVRISPFDANSRRHTSFASVFVYPEIDDNIDVEVNESDLRIDTYRASGAGGQHVNKTDSAVRITHLPTNIVVACQNERSQHKNKAMAMRILRSRLYELELEKQREMMDSYAKAKKDIAWGSQIRSYVLHPYRMVKDHRTNVEIGNADAVLDGDIDRFIQSCLMEAEEG